ncbi:hypothetical protein FPZ43_13795 [Mucilaginibacter pallidiroseus]|uniref:Uncharacterized protein n=1 Tax=Mucilaginibacter pallidiroseus TaxID=2599295 RepID=A0A563U833_9SPHI|nr:hypothetical protein [Mucilaginibacter pallidiroseus]TWR27541.1 hypothetical protein FPZ43_13795 [Mucilaginibacter pallidiroseus]
MKKPLLLLLFVFATYPLFAQRTVGPVEQKLTDNLCACLNKLDMGKIANKQEAEQAFMDCFMGQMDLAEDLAKERGIELTDKAEMHKVGVDVGKNLLNQKCESFLKLAVKMAAKDNAGEAWSISRGVFKRVDKSGYTYLVISEGGSEKTYLWLRQFPGSEAFMGAATKLVGKKVKITWLNMEVYLPSAKGYYQLKEIKQVDIL